MRRNKQGFELAISTLVVIVISLLVLAALIIAFTTGFESFWSKIKGYFGSDIDNANKMCQSQCLLDNKESFCCGEKMINGENTTCLDERLKTECSVNCEGVC